jgi:hypothetical protein
MEGREAGTRGYDISAAYVAARYKALGLTPIGDMSTYYQYTPLRAYGAAGEGSVAFKGKGAPRKFKHGEDYIALPTPLSMSADITAPVVFVGYGLVAPKYGRDDYAGLDVNGKIVALLSGAPEMLDSEEAAHFNATRTKRASDRGAIGVIQITTPTLEERFPFERFAKGFGNRTQMTWVGKDGVADSDAPNLRATGFVSLQGAEKMFEKAPQKWSEILAAMKSEGGKVQGFELGYNATMKMTSRHEEIESVNVVAMLPGTDPVLKNEFVILTAHLDHTGVRVTEEEGDDEINNGAMDNATGVSAMMETARLLAMNPPKRSVIFAAVTAEEKGLVGSSYLAANPVASPVVANVNIDMPVATYDFLDVVAFGAERSTLGPVIRTAAGKSGVALSPDPMPEQRLFTRSDQYEFVKKGVPAVFLVTGFQNGGEEAFGTFLSTHYHKPSDEVELVNFDALTKFTRVNADIARDVANMPERPRWNEGDFFGELYGGE